MPPRVNWPASLYMVSGDRLKGTVTVTWKLTVPGVNEGRKIRMTMDPSECENLIRQLRSCWEGVTGRGE